MWPSQEVPRWSSEHGESPSGVQVLQPGFLALPALIEPRRGAWHAHDASTPEQRQVFYPLERPSLAFAGKGA